MSDLDRIMREFDALPDARERPDAMSSIMAEFDALPDVERPGAISNIVRGAGERALDLGGGLVRAVGGAAETVGDALERAIPLGGFEWDERGVRYKRFSDEDIKAKGIQGVTDRAAGALEDTSLGYQPGTTWEDVKASPLRKFIPFAIEQGLVSAPDMAGALAALPAYIAARTGEVGQGRAEADLRDNATVGDLLVALPPAIAMSMLERIGAKGMFGLDDAAVQSFKQIPRAAAGAAVKEAGTEFLQEGIEYGTTNIGTATGFDPAEALDRSIAGAVAGGTFGGGIRAGTGAIEARLGGRSRPAANPNVEQTEPEAGIPAGAAPGEDVIGSDPGANPFEDLVPSSQESPFRTDAPRVPSQPQQPAQSPFRTDAPSRPMPAADPDPDRASSPRLTPQDRASPLPNSAIDDGKLMMEEALAGRPLAAPDRGSDETGRSQVRSEPAAQGSQPGAPAIGLGGIAGTGIDTDGISQRPAAGSPATGIAPTQIAQERQGVPSMTSRPQGQTLPVATAPEGDQASPAMEDMRRNPGSWVIRDKTSGEVVMETFDRRAVDALNTEKYEAIPAIDYLSDLNRSIKDAGGAQPAPEPTAPTTDAPRVLPTAAQTEIKGRKGRHKLVLKKTGEDVFPGQTFKTPLEARKALKQARAEQRPMRPATPKTRQDKVRILKRPAAAAIMARGGIDPDSPIARELKTRDITPRTFPGLFRKGGMRALDNIPRSEESLFRGGQGDFATDVANERTYIQPDEWVAALEAEYAGSPLRTADELEQERLNTGPGQVNIDRETEFKAAMPMVEREFLDNGFDAVPDDMSELLSAQITAGYRGQEAVDRAIDLHFRSEPAYDAALDLLSDEDIDELIGARPAPRPARQSGTDTAATLDAKGTRFPAVDPFDMESADGLDAENTRGDGERAGDGPVAAAGTGDAQGADGAPVPSGPRAETGADGKPQLTLDGFEQRPREAAQIAANKPLKPKADQRPMDEGLFGDGAAQTDLVDMAKRPQKKAVSSSGDYGTPERPNRAALSQAYFDYFSSPDNRFSTITEARKFAADLLGGPVQPGTEAAKIIDEAIEVGVVKAGRLIVGASRKRGALVTFDRLVDLYDRQPRLGVRTSTSVANQAYSTPLPLAWVASELGGITTESWVYEPTAGNGALLIGASTDAKVLANELDPDRAAMLKEVGFSRVTSRDAVDRTATTVLQNKQGGVDVVIANPPFGAVRENGEAKRFKVDGRYETSEIDHAISFRALEAMRDKGKAVLILGGVNKLAASEEARSKAYNGKAKREFYYALYQAYNVVDHFTVDGALYEKQGAGWPVDVIVIDGRGKSSMTLPAAQPPRILRSWNEVRSLLDDKARASGPSRSNNVGSAGESGQSGAQPSDARGGSVVSERRPAAADAGGIDQGGVSDGVRAGSDRGQRNAVRPDRADERGTDREGVEGPDTATTNRSADVDDFDLIFDAALDAQFGAAPTAAGQDLPAAQRADNPLLVVETGAVFRTKSGRETSPAPKIEATSPRKTEASRQRMNAWLLSEAQIEARIADEAGPRNIFGESSGYLQTLLKGMDPRKLSQSDQDTINDILFGDPDGATRDVLIRVEGGGKKPTKPRTARSAGEAAVSAAKNAAMGLDEVAAGLNALFGGNKLSSGFTFDEDTYRKAMPYFRAGVQHFAKAGSDIREMVGALVKHLAETAGMTRDAINAMRPYIRRFMQEVTDGTISIDAETAPDTKTAAKKQAAERQPADIEAKQVAYKPRSAQGAMDTLVPVNMQDAVQEALAELSGRVGDIDEWVASELGYKPSELGRYFAAEQVDGIALALNNFSQNKGFIIGDQTGIGKGRQVAAVLRWAMKNGKTPIFVTEKPNLYADMWRDLEDIGVPEMLGRDPKVLMTNSGEKIPLNDEGTKELKSAGAALHAATMRKLMADGSLGEYDLIFTTYSQMQTVKGERTERMDFLESMVQSNGVLVFDESHNAGGTAAVARGPKGKETINRATFARQLISMADAVLYSSATYAKRPDVMDLYSKTDMSLAVDDIGKLGDLIARGGVPMQQIVAAMLSKAGQYVRRERSFDGIVYDSPSIPVDRAAYDRFATALNTIQAFSENHVKSATKGIDKEVKADGKAIMADGSTGGAGASSTNFTAIMHNVINQMLLAIKADAAADMAIESLRQGEKPVITVSSTMESFVNEYAKMAGLNPGDAIDISFSDLLQRYLERTRVITIKKPFAKKGESERHRLTDAELGPSGVQAFKAAQDLIARSDFGNLPVSPIDYIKAKVERAGFKTGEITGRNMIIKYGAEGRQRLATRPAADLSIAGRRRAISGFNGGSIDLIVLNQAGSTGLSLHASEKVKDRRKRHMIIAQAEGNIDTHMQMLGRVNRTGQVIAPRYSQLVADAPAEKRPAAVLAKKMASLNANTTASRDSALTAKDVPDFMNEYGDKVAIAVMIDNPDIHRRLSSPLGDDPSSQGEDAIRKVTGRIPLLPLKDQELIYDMLEGEYESFLAQMEAAGENALEAKTLDLGAITKERIEARAPQQDGSPFADGVWYEVVDAKRLGKPMSSKQVIDTLAANLDVVVPGGENPLADLARVAQKKTGELFGEARDQFKGYMRSTLDEIESDKTREAQRTRLEDIRDRWGAIASFAVPGDGVKLTGENLGTVYGIVVNVKKTGKATNPLAMGSWKVTVALADASRQITIPFSQLYTPRIMQEGDEKSRILIGRTSSIGDMPILKAFDDMQIERREERVIVTGNVLAGYETTGAKGTIINFTSEDGRIRQGILMRKGFEAQAHVNALAVALPEADHVIAYTRKVKGTLFSTDRLAGVAMHSNGNVIIITDAGRGKGGKYYLDQRVLAAAGRDFVRSGSSMRIEVSPSTALRVIDAMQQAGAKFAASENPDVAREIVEGERSKFSIRRTETERYALPGGGELRVELERAFGEKAEAIRAQMRAELDRMGLAQVGLNVVDTIRLIQNGEVSHADGRYFRGLIDVALDASDPHKAMQHEAIHALKRAGAFADKEWAALERRSKAVWMKKYNISEAYGFAPEMTQIEEGIAHAYADWYAGQRKEAGVFRAVFQKIRNLIDAIRNALQGNGFRSPEGIFADVFSGKVGARSSAPPASRGLAPQFSVAPPTSSEAFKRWFGDSKVVDADGKPLVVYHGTNADIERGNFRFRSDTIGSANDGGFFGRGFYFATTKGEASYYGGKIVPAYLSIQSPLDLNNNTGDLTFYGHFKSWAPKLEAIGALDRKYAEALQSSRRMEQYVRDNARVLPFVDSYRGKEGFIAKVKNPAEGYTDEISISSRAAGEAKTEAEAIDELVLTVMDEMSRFHKEQYPNLELAETSLSDYVRVGMEGGSERLTVLAKAAGHDGVFYGDEIVAFSPSQIKSVNNRGTFDPNDDRIMFSLQQEPQTAQEKQNLLLGFINAGQPIDSAFRAVFAPFGGYDSEGKWNPGKKITAAARKAIVEAKFSDDSPVSFINPALEKVRNGLIDRYGLDPEYVRADRNRSLDQRAILSEGEEFLKVLQDASVGRQEAKVLQAMLTGEEVGPADMEKLAEPIRKAIDDLGQQAVELGLISRESYERNRGAYLHRVYLKHETQKDSLIRWTDSIGSTVRKRIIGNQMKGRGIFLDVAKLRLMRDVKEWTEGYKGDPQIGDKLRVIDEISPQTDAMESGRKEKVLRRVYLPAGMPVPARYQGAAWKDQGTWEIRGKKDGKYTIWRDYTKAEREAMGEILDARYTVAKTYLLLANDLSNGRFFQKIAANEQWSRTQVSEGEWRNTTDRDKGEAWVKVPDTVIPQTGGRKRYGALAGRFVRPEIWRDLNELERMQSPGWWRAILTQWKLNKTARNPVVHMNNVMSNIILADMVDVTAADIVTGIRSFISGDEMYQDALKHGAFGVDMISQEVRNNHLKPVLEEIIAEEDGKDSWADRARIIGKLATIWDKVMWADQKMREAYQAEDEIFRMAFFIKRRRMGDDAFTAAEMAREQFLDYDIRAPWVNLARNTALPFIAYTYRAVPLIATAMTERPHKLAKYATLAFLANALAYALDDEGDEEKERASLRPEEQGYTWLGTPRMIRLPYRDENGMPVFLDIRRWIPAGDVFDTNQGSSAIPMPAWLQFGGPMMLAAEYVLNKQGFTGEPITNDLTDTTAEKMWKVADWAYKSWMPSAPWIPGSWYWQKIADAAAGATDYGGNPYSLPQAVLNSTGIKVKPQDVETGFGFRAFEGRQEVRELRAQARRLARQRERGLISESAYERDLSIIVLKLERVAERMRLLGEVAGR